MESVCVLPPEKCFTVRAFLCQIIIIYYKYIVLCDDSIACNSILEFAVMVFEKQEKSQGKVGVMSIFEIEIKVESIIIRGQVSLG